MTDEGLDEGQWRTNLVAPVSTDCWAWLQFQGPVTQDGIDVLMRYLELCRDAFPLGVSVTCAAPPPPADREGA